MLCSLRQTKVSHLLNLLPLCIPAVICTITVWWSLKTFPRQCIITGQHIQLTLNGQDYTYLDARNGTLWIRCVRYLKPSDGLQCMCRGKKKNPRALKWKSHLNLLFSCQNTSCWLCYQSTEFTFHMNHAWKGKCFEIYHRSTAQAHFLWKQMNVI